MISNNFVKDAKKYDKVHGIVDEKHDPDDEGYTLGSNKSYATILNRKYLTHNTIAHEMYHLTCNIGEATGITDEESRAWICGYITEEIYKLITKWTLKQDISPAPVSLPPSPTTSPSIIQKSI